MTKTWRLKFLYFCIIFKTPTKEANRFQFSILQNMSLDANAMIFFLKIRVARSLIYKDIQNKRTVKMSYTAFKSRAPPPQSLMFEEINC